MLLRIHQLFFILFVHAFPLSCSYGKAQADEAFHINEPFLQAWNYWTREIPKFQAQPLFTLFPNFPIEPSSNWLLRLMGHVVRVFNHESLGKKLSNYDRIFVGKMIWTVNWKSLLLRSSSAKSTLTSINLLDYAWDVYCINLIHWELCEHDKSLWSINLDERLWLAGSLKFKLRVLRISSHKSMTRAMKAEIAFRAESHSG